MPQVVINTLINLAISYVVSRVFAPKKKTYSPKLKDNEMSVRAATEFHRVIYGRSITSGPVIFPNKKGSAGENNKTLHMIVLLAAHEVDAIEEVYFDDIPSSAQSYTRKKKVDVQIYIDRTSSYPGGTYRLTLNNKLFVPVVSGGRPNHPALGMYNAIVGDPGYAAENYVATRGNGGDSWITIESKNNGDDFTLTAGFYTSALVLVRTLPMTTREVARNWSVTNHLGGVDQAANADAVAAFPDTWTSNHRLRGRAYVYVKLDYDENWWPNGIPNIKAVVRGKKVYDPRTGLTVWSDNWALCLRDYLTSSQGLSAAVDNTNVIAEANICDETVYANAAVSITASVAGNPALVKTTTAAGVRPGDTVVIVGHSQAALNGTWTAGRPSASQIADNGAVENVLFTVPANLGAAGTGGTVQIRQTRYTCNGSYNLGEDPYTTLGRMLSAADGRAIDSAGTWRIYSAAYRAPVYAIDESDLAGVIGVQTKAPRKDRFNGVRGTFVDPHKFHQETDFPPVSNAGYVTQDGEAQWLDVTLSFTSDTYRAQRIARLLLERSRQAMTVSLVGKPGLLLLSPPDNTQISIGYLGWANKEFRVTDWEITPDCLVKVTLREEAASAYTWSPTAATLSDPAPNTNLPSPFLVVAPGAPTITEALYQTVDGNGVKTKAVIVWLASTDIYVREYRPEYRLITDELWRSLGRTPSLSAEVLDIAPGEYAFRVAAINTVGVYAYSETTVLEILGLTAAPANVTGVELQALDSLAMVSWDEHPDLDVRIAGTFKIRHSSKLVGALWSDGVDVGRKVIPGNATSAEVPLISGTYMVKAIDSSKNESVSPGTASTDAATLFALNVVATSTQSPTFPGTHTNTIVDTGALKLVGTTLWDSMTTLMDTWGNIDSLGGVVASGNYLFSDTIDLGAVYTSRLTATLTTDAFEVTDTVDERTQLMDDWGAFDGAVVSDAYATLYVRTTPDDPAGAPVWGAWRRFAVADYNARGLQFKVDLTSLHVDHNVRVTGLSVTVDMPDRIESARNVTVPTAGLRINFTSAFKATPALSVTAYDLASGDIAGITNEGPTGFNIGYTNGGSGVQRRIDWYAKSYGKAA